MPTIDIVQLIVNKRQRKREIVLQIPGLGPEHNNEKELFFSSFDCFTVLSST